MEWKNIKEDRPKKEGDYLVRLEDKEQHTASWGNKNGFLIVGGLFSYDRAKITHWMNLPKDPETV